MKNFITAVFCTSLALCTGFTVYAAENLDRDYIESEILEDMRNGKGDDGLVFLEASYKHHLLDKWVEENYGSDDYDWTVIGELKYSYRNYYKNLTENWDFNDDNGIWTIETEDNFYSFQLVNNQWNMLDENGSIVDIFPIFSTFEEEKAEHPIDDNRNNSPRVIGDVTRTETPPESHANSDGKITEETIENVVEIDVKRSESSPLPFVIGGLAIVVSGTAFIMYKKRK